MIDDAPLPDLRVGCVQYLNAKPLLHGYQGPVVFEHPSRLATMLSDHELDLGLVPVFELFRSSDYRVADGVSISSRGPVFSVFLAYRGALEDVATVALDSASLTSANLLRCLLAEFYGMQPRYLNEHAPADARLWIGNQAIAFRLEHAAEFHFLDLGEEWTRQTGLPFVYALWLIRREVQDAIKAAEVLRQLKKRGVESISEIVAKESLYSSEFRLKYLREYIRYDFGDAERAGLEKFHDLCVKHGLASRLLKAWEYV